MMQRKAPGFRLYAAIAGLASLLASSGAAGAGDASRGASLFQACAACHSTKPEVQMTGPSLAHVWGRKAGTLPGFSRYSEALKHANVVWNESTLDRWLTHPDAFISGTTMTFPGIRDSRARQDVIAYLQALSERNAPPATDRGNMTMGMQSQRENLKKAPPAGQVAALSHCKDTYTVKTVDGKVNKVWEFNLRLKTDSSDMGPEPGKPVIVGNGMQGDRAAVVFASPDEISHFISERCP
jgi:cytochrome c